MKGANAVRVRRSYTQHIVAPPEEVFPLLCPVRERDWLEGWRCRMIYSETGFAERGCVFATRRPDEAETVWTITEHDRDAARIAFTLVTPGSRVGDLRIELTGNDDGTTAAHITYTFTALTEAGERFIGEFSEAEFTRRMRRWEAALNHYLQTGMMLE